MSIDKAKRSLGQNFFTNKNLAEKIVKYVSDTNPDLVVEIGPGRGVFTHLLSKEHNVLAIEKDFELYTFLSKHFNDSDNVEIIEQDILDLPENFFDNPKFKDQRITLYGSLPYNISKRIIASLLQLENIENHFYIIQKEVAQKYTAKDISNRLSLLVDLYADCRILETIKPSNFKPAPKVTSSLTHFKKKTEHILTKKQSLRYQKLLNSAFASPRKKLKNNLKGTIYYDNLPKDLENLRAEELNAKQYLSILGI